MKKYFALIATAILFGCSSPENSIYQNDSIQIRLQNSSPYNFKNIIVDASTHDTNGNLDRYQFSNYQVFDKAYSYAYIRLEINGQTCTLRPVDYVGETPLENGRYTYNISAELFHGKYVINATFVKN